MVTQIESRQSARSGWFSQSSLLYEDEYILLAVISALDVVMSYLLLHFGGSLYYNAFDDILAETGIYSVLLFKLVIVALVVMACETIGYRRPTLGRKLINTVNILSAVALGTLLYQFSDLIIF